MSRFGFDFLKNLDCYLGRESEDFVDVQFKYGTYCFLASESGKAVLEENIEIQRCSRAVHCKYIIVIKYIVTFLGQKTLVYHPCQKKNYLKNIHG